MTASPTDESRQRAQTSPIGVVLILGITMAAAIAMVVLGTAALEDTQTDTKIGQAEQSLTQFDSRVAQVALGDSSSKNVGLGTGDYQVDPAAGSVTIKHVNATGDGNEEVIYSKTDLGSLSYSLDGTTIAYQGGGVWRQDAEDGVARMVSPPEFHYRDATLTFPIILLRGEAVRSGATQAQVDRSNPVTDIYPREETYSDGSPYQNPVDNGTVVVEIESQYCEGWRSYFIARTDGEVTECVDDTVTAEIISIGDQGPFDILDGSLEIRGAEVGDPEEEEEDEFQFEITFTEEGSDSNSGFSNFAWTMYGENVDDSDRQFEVYMESGGGSCGDYVEIYVYHSNDGGETFQTWQNTSAFQIECDDDDTESFTADFLSDVNMSYEAADPFMTDGGGRSIPKYNDGDRTSDDMNDNPLGDNHTELENVTRHYMDVMGDMDLNFQERQQGQAGIGDASEGFIQYPGDGRVVTYLHITENEVEVELRSG